MHTNRILLKSLTLHDQFTAIKKVFSETNLFGKILHSVGCDPLNSKVEVMLMLHKKPRAMTTSDVST